jgi:uncharacterized cupin superfamily protein
VIYVLKGEGPLHADDRSQPVSPGSSIQRPKGILHCLENAGDRTMRVAAVFRPAGSPAAAYHHDGSPAHPHATLLTREEVKRASAGH